MGDSIPDKLKDMKDKKNSTSEKFLLLKGENNIKVEH